MAFSGVISYNTVSTKKISYTPSSLREYGYIQYETQNIKPEKRTTQIISTKKIKTKKINNTVSIKYLQYKPLSYGYTVIGDNIYSGIELTNYKIGQQTISGNETANDFFMDSIIEEYDVNWGKVISQFAVGTVIIFVTGILHFSSGQTAPVFYAMTADIFMGSLTGAISGAATDALMAGMVATLEGRPQEGIFKATIEGASSGYMWGAIVGAVTGSVSGYTKITPSVSNELANYLKKGPLTLSKGQLDNILNDPSTLRTAIREMTGARTMKAGYKEFFVRLAKGDPDQVKTIWKNKALQERIKDLIRYLGGNHEWLMASKFMEYLVDCPFKNADDGLKAAIALDKLVQATSGENAVEIAVKALDESGDEIISTFTHSANNDITHLWHNELDATIKNSSSFSDAINRIYKFARETLTADSFLALKDIILAL